MNGEDVFAKTDKFLNNSVTDQTNKSFAANLEREKNPILISQSGQSDLEDD